MHNLRNKRALITGAASGIGRAIALRLAEEGVRLVLIDIDEVGLASTVSQCRHQGVDVIGRRCDVSQPDQVSKTAEVVLDRWDGVDILINNAGITYYGRTHLMSAENWERLLQINLYAHIQFTRELLPAMLDRPEAHIVNVCSVFGLVAVPKVNAYCVSKFGLVGFSESLRAEYGRDGLGVTAICPGFVDTNLFTSAPLEDDVPQHKIPPHWVRTSPEKVARATVKAIRHDRRLVVVEPLARSIYMIKRFVPGLLDFTWHLGRRRRLRRKLAHGEGVDDALPTTVEMPARTHNMPDRAKRRAA